MLWLPVEGSPWYLQFDEDGYACLYNLDGDTLFLEDWLSKQVWRASCGRFFVEESGVSAPWSLIERMTEYEKKTAIIQCVGREEEFSVFKVRWPRGSGRFFWSQVRVYSYLQFTLCNGRAAKWLDKSKKGWQALPDSFNLHGHVLKSSAA